MWEIPLYEGINELKDNNTKIKGNPSILVEKLQTAWTGLCLKIKMNYFTSTQRAKFILMFNESLKIEDIPTPEIYVTSEDNLNGIIAFGWVNGEELKFTLEGTRLLKSHFKVLDFSY